MGLEALVESYAFWRPSLRTLTFEDIPGMAKQGTVELVNQRVLVLRICQCVLCDCLQKL